MENQNIVQENINNFTLSLRSIPFAIGKSLNPSYLKFIILSVVINIVLFVISIVVIVTLLNFFEDRIVNQAHELIKAALDILLLGASIYLSVIVFPTLSMIVNSPIYDHITSKILDELEVTDQNETNFVKDIAISISFESKKIFILIMFFIATLILNVIPFVGSGVFVFLNILSVILINGLDSFDPPLSRQRKNFRGKLWFISKRPTLWPYLFLTATINSFPILNIFTIPVSIISSSKISAEILRR